MRSTNIISVILTQSVLFAHAQSDISIVVTATKTPRPLKDVPAETILIKKEDTRKSNAKNVSELLRDVPGFNIVGENTAGSSAYLSRFRGFDFDKGYGLILINGERVLGGGMGEYGISLNQMPSEMIEKIEIVKGGSSVLYGSDAITGVVNIITKPIPEKPTFTVSGGYGSYKTSQLNICYGRKIEKFGFLLNTHNETSQRGRYGASEDDFDGAYILTKLSYDFSNKVKFSLGNNYDKLQWRYQIEKKYRLSPSFELLLPSGAVLNIKGYWHKLFMDSFSPGYTRRTGDIKYTQTELQYSRFFGRNHFITLGAEYLQRDIDSNFANKIDTIRGFYLQDEITKKPLNIDIGCRIDAHSLYGTETNPRVSFMWETSDKIRIRTSAGSAFKSPTIRQLYVFFRHGNWWNKPNCDLKPETSWSYSAGIEHTISKNVSMNFGLFRNDVKDIVIAVETSEKIDNIPIRTWKNAQGAFAQGIELGMNATLLDILSMNLSYTYTDTENTDTKKKLPYNPYNSAGVGMNYHVKQWETSFRWKTNYYSSAYTDETNTKQIESYSISNLKITKDIIKDISFSIDVDNIFESNY
ncbi:MAG: TonB-dependent receptor, partial [Elusimicrobiota bacterium]